MLMKIFRQIIAWLAMICILAGGIPLSAAKAEEPSEIVGSGTIGSVSWTITHYYDAYEGYITRTVLDVFGSGVIPDYTDRQTAPWFQDPNGRYFTGINIGSGITRIGNFAFSGGWTIVNTIDKVVIPDTVTEIGNYAFYHQDHLHTIILPDSVTVLGEHPFASATTIYCSSHSPVFQSVQQQDGNYYESQVHLTDLQITLTLGSESATEVTLNRGEEISYRFSTNVQGVTPKVKTANGLDLDTERQIVRATGSGITSSVIASAYGVEASCKVYIRKVYKVHLWEGFYIDDLGEDTYNENESYYPDYTLTRPGYVLRGWYIAKKIWSSGQGCYVFEFHLVTSVSDGDYDLFSFWDRDIAAAEITAIPDQTYTGEAITPDVTVTLDGNVLVKDRDYTLSYQDNIQSGEATVEIAGIGNYGGTVKTKFMIKPPATSITSLKNSAKKTVTVKWKKAGSGSGYQIQYGLKKNMNGAKTLTVKKLKPTSAKIKNLKKGKTYYVRIRVYKTVKNRKIYSKWSSVKKVKVTK